MRSLFAAILALLLLGASGCDHNAGTCGTDCGEWRCSDPYEVETLEEGGPVQLETLCQSEGAVPIRKDIAARLTIVDADSGRITLAEQLRGRVVGEPDFLVIERETLDVVTAKFTGIEETSDGFVFDLEIRDMYGWYQFLDVWVTLQIDCEDYGVAGTVALESATVLEWCYLDQYLEESDPTVTEDWRASGQQCYRCGDDCSMF